MNHWRWLGICLFLMGVASFVSPQLGVLAQDKDKDKAVEKDKGGEKDKAAAKDKEKDKQAVPEKGDVLSFTAFKSGSPAFYQELKTKTKQTMSVNNQQVVQVQNQTFTIRWTPEKEDEKGNYKVKQEIVGIEMMIDIGGQPISFNSAAPGPKNPMTDFFSALQKQQLTFIISKDLKVEDVQGHDQFVKNLGETNPQMLTLLKQILTKDALTKMAEPTWWALPDGPVSKDKEWKKSSNLKLGPIGNYATNFTFAYNGLEGKLDKIGIKADVKYAPPTEKENGGLPFVIKEGSTLSSSSATGEAMFDREKGRFDSSKIEMKLKGDLKIVVGNMETSITLDQEQSSSSKTYDNNPLPEEKKK